MKDRSFLQLDSFFPHSGLNTLRPSTQMPANFSPNCMNVSVTDGLLVKRRGYTLLGNLTNVGAADPVMAIINFQDVNEVNHTVAVTTKKRYLYDSSGPTWMDITGSTPWTGDETNRVSYVLAAGTDTGKCLVMTNGVDKPQIWTGTGNFADVTFNYPNFVTCETISLVGGYLLMANITNSVSGNAPQNIAWSGAGQVNEWLDPTTGAGEQTIYDTKGPIQALVPFGSQLAIYADNTIHLATYVGGQLVFTFTKVLEDIRLLSSQSIVNLGMFHVFMNQDSIQLFDGTLRIVSIGDAIHKTYRAELAATYRARAFTLLDRARRRAYFAIPTSSSTTKVYQLDYDLNNISNWKWTPQSYNDRPEIFGFYIPDTSIKWNSSSISSTTWANAVGTWASTSGVVSLPSLVIGTASGQVLLIDDSAPVYNDNATMISCYWDTMDFTLPQEYESSIARWIELNFEAIGGAVDISYSIDGGNSYVSIQSNLALTSNWTMYRAYFDTTARTLRFRFSNNYSNSDLQIRWIRPYFASSGAY